MKRIILLGSILLTGCAMHFSHPTKSDQDLKRDWTDCQAKAGQANMGSKIAERDFLSDCMEGQGWKRE